MRDIKVIRNGMSNRQSVEAMMFGVKHDEQFNKIKKHTWTGKLGNYQVTANKTIRVRIVK